MAVTQQQIADMAGVSRSTVTRVLNHYSDIDPQIAENVRKIAAELGYVPNRAGTLLKRAKKPFRIGIVVQSAETPFMAELCKHMEQSRDSLLQEGAELFIKPLPGINADKQLAALAELQILGIEGLAIAPVEDERIRQKIDALSEAGIPVVTFNTDMRDTRRLCYVGQNSEQGGRTCAGLMKLLLNDTGKILMITGHRFNSAHERRVTGFAAEMERRCPGIDLLPLTCCDQNDTIAYDIVRRATAEEPELVGIYASANGPYGVCQALRRVRRKIHFVCHDAFAQNVQNVQDGYIDFLIDQDSKAQATMPCRILLDYLLTGQYPEKECIYTNIGIRNQYNIINYM